MRLFKGNCTQNANERQCRVVGFVGRVEKTFSLFITCEAKIEKSLSGAGIGLGVKSET